MNAIVLSIMLSALCIAIMALSGRVTWQFYRSADKTNRILILVFVSGVMLMALVVALGKTLLDNPVIIGVISIVAFIANGALLILMAREMWGVYQRIRLIRLVNTLEEPEEQ